MQVSAQLPTDKFPHDNVTIQNVLLGPENMLLLLLWVKRGTTSFLYTHRQFIVMTVLAYAAHGAGGKLEPFEYELGSLKPDEVEIDVEYCGICHSDLSMIKNEWFTYWRSCRDSYDA